MRNQSLSEDCGSRCCSYGDTDHQALGVKVTACYFLAVRRDSTERATDGVLQEMPVEKIRQHIIVANKRIPELADVNMLTYFRQSLTIGRSRSCLIYNCGEQAVQGAHLLAIPQHIAVTRNDYARFEIADRPER